MIWSSGITELSAAATPDFGSVLDTNVGAFSIATTGDSPTISLLSAAAFKTH